MDSPEQPTRRSFLQSVAACAPAAMCAAAAGADAVPKPPADSPRELAATGGDLGSLYRELSQLATDRKFTLSFLSGRFRDLESFKRAARAKIFEAFLYRPPKVDPRPQVIDRADCGGYLREKVLFSTGPQFRVPAYVLIPKGLTKPAPAIVDLHSHGGKFLFGKEKVIDLGTNHPMMAAYHERNYDGRPTATALVKRGYVVISIDAFFFGERRLIMDEDLKYGWDRTQYSLEDAEHLNRKCRGKETTLAKSMASVGLTWPGIVHWDDIRTVDYLASREEVDAARIGCQGISMGGDRTAYLAGLDERIKAAVVVGFMSTVDGMLRDKIDTHSWVHFPPTVHQFLDLPDVVSMMAPKPLFVQQCRQDGLFTVAGMQASLDKIAAVYEKAGAGDRFTGRFYDVPHRYTIAMQDDAFAFFDQHLKPGG